MQNIYQTSICLDPHQKIRVKHVKPYSKMFHRPFQDGTSLVLVFRVCHDVLSVPCGLVVTCWERANLLALLCVMFSCVCVLGQVWYLIVSVPGSRHGRHIGIITHVSSSAFLHF